MTQAQGNIYVFPKSSNPPPQAVQTPALNPNWKEPEPIESGAAWLPSLEGRAADLPCDQLNLIHEALWSMSKHLETAAYYPTASNETHRLLFDTHVALWKAAGSLFDLAYVQEPTSYREREGRARLIVRHSLFSSISGSAAMIINAAEEVMELASGPAA